MYVSLPKKPENRVYTRCLCRNTNTKRLLAIDGMYVLHRKLLLNTKYERLDDKTELSAV